MRQKYIKRKPNRSDIVLRVGRLVGLNSLHLKRGYLSRKDWLELESTLNNLVEKCKEFNYADQQRSIQS
jgi:hypothetical protein